MGQQPPYTSSDKIKITKFLCLNCISYIKKRIGWQEHFTNYCSLLRNECGWSQYVVFRIKNDKLKLNSTPQIQGLSAIKKIYFKFFSSFLKFNEQNDGLEEIDISEQFFTSEIKENNYIYQTLEHNQILSKEEYIKFVQTPSHTASIISENEKQQNDYILANYRNNTLISSSEIDLNGILNFSQIGKDNIIKKLKIFLTYQLSQYKEVTKEIERQVNKKNFILNQIKSFFQDYFVFTFGKKLNLFNAHQIQVKDLEILNQQILLEINSFINAFQETLCLYYQLDVLEEEQAKLFEKLGITQYLAEYSCFTKDNLINFVTCLLFTSPLYSVIFQIQRNLDTNHEKLLTNGFYFCNKANIEDFKVPAALCLNQVSYQYYYQQLKTAMSRNSMNQSQLQNDNNFSINFVYDNKEEDNDNFNSNLLISHQKIERNESYISQKEIVQSIKKQANKLEQFQANELSNDQNHKSRLYSVYSNTSYKQKKKGQSKSYTANVDYGLIQKYDYLESSNITQLNQKLKEQKQNESIQQEQNDKNQLELEMQFEIQKELQEKLNKEDQKYIELENLSPVKKTIQQRQLKQNIKKLGKKLPFLEIRDDLKLYWNQRQQKREWKLMAEQYIDVLNFNESKQQGSLLQDQLPYQSAIECIRELQFMTSPIHKLKVLVKASKIILEYGDDIMNIFFYIVSKCNIKSFYTHIQIMENFTTLNMRKSICGYYLNVVQMCLDQLEDLSELKINYPKLISLNENMNINNQSNLQL